MSARRRPLTATEIVADASSLRDVPFDTLIEAVEQMYESAHARFHTASRENRLDALVDSLDWPEMIAKGRADAELEARASAERAMLVEELAATLDTGDVAAFGRLSARWRDLPSCVREYVLAWNGVDTPELEVADFEVSPVEFTETAKRLRRPESERAQ